MEVMGAYGWQDGKLCMVARTKEGPYSMDNVFRFEEDGVYVDGCSVGIAFVGAFAACTSFMRMARYAVHIVTHEHSAVIISRFIDHLLMHKGIKHITVNSAAV